MKLKLVLSVGIMSALPALALAANSSSGTASVVRPDGSAVTQNFTTAGGSTAWFQAAVTAGHSYVVEAEAPFDGEGSLGGGSPSMTIAVFQNDGSTPVASSSLSTCAPATGATGSRVTFTPSAADVTGGAVKISVANGAGSDYNFRFRLYETGLFCTRWSINGYSSFVNVQNTSDCAVNATLVLYRSDGTVASTTPVALNASGSTQLSITGGMTGGALFGSAAVFHNGAKGAVTGGIYQVTSGFNYQWACQETRSSGSTSGQ